MQRVNLAYVAILDEEGNVFVDEETKCLPCEVTNEQEDFELAAAMVLSEHLHLIYDPQNLVELADVTTTKAHFKVFGIALTDTELVPGEYLTPTVAQLQGAVTPDQLAMCVLFACKDV